MSTYKSAYDGLKAKNPDIPYAKENLKGKSVNAGATRDSTGEGGDEAGPGPRTA